MVIVARRERNQPEIVAGQEWLVIERLQATPDLACRQLARVAGRHDDAGLPAAAERNEHPATGLHRGVSRGGTVVELVRQGHVDGYLEYGGARHNFF